MKSSFLFDLVRPILFGLEPETAHHVTLDSLKRAHQLGLTRLCQATIGSPRTIMGLNFPNPVGLAAGLDKNGTYIDALAPLGFGFIEVGTVTPKPQPGNSKPRMFRIASAKALINRMGFNNDGLERFLANIKNTNFKGVLGLNIGKNATTPIEQAIDDYITGLRAVYPYASYVTVNISSPNTKDLRQLQAGSELDKLLPSLKDEQSRLAQSSGRYVPIAVKIAPDLEQDQIRIIAGRLHKYRIDGLIATNTTTSRPEVEGQVHSTEAGGLSGMPLLDLSNQVIRTFKQELGNDIPIIGVGGILSGADAKAKIDAGASLVQLYTGLIYRGPTLIHECVNALSQPSTI